VFVCILPEKAIPEMTYTVSGGMLNPTHSFIRYNLKYYFYSCALFINTEPAKVLPSPYLWFCWTCIL